MKPTLLVLAAGLGSRYGGLKQLDPVGPSGQVILDYSLYDALQAGFGKVVFVIRQEFAAVFEESLVKRMREKIEVACVFQELGDLPEGFSPPEGRSRPWGTAHAVRAARDCIGEPFAVINADDFYGREAFRQMAAFLAEASTDKLEMGMVGYRLENTLSEHGSVNRGICTVEEDELVRIEEMTGISRDVEGTLKGDTASGETLMLSPDATVSMNFWGFNPLFFEHLEQGFHAFILANRDHPKVECYLPSIVNDLITTGKGSCRVLPTTSQWFGVTYPEDKESVRQHLERLTTQGEYPANG